MHFKMLLLRALQRGRGQQLKMEMLPHLWAYLADMLVPLESSTAPLVKAGSEGLCDNVFSCSGQGSTSCAGGLSLGAVSYK